MREPVFAPDSTECLIEAAKNGLGFYAGYEQMSISKKTNLQNILPDQENS